MKKADAETKADDEHQTNSATARAAAATSLLEAARSAGPLSSLNTSAIAGSPSMSGPDAALIESILAQEQQRRRAFLLMAAAGAPFPSMGAGAAGGSLSSGANVTNPTTSALLAAERQRALMFGSSLELSPLDHLLLMSSSQPGGGGAVLGGGLLGAGGAGTNSMGSSLHSLLGGMIMPLQSGYSAPMLGQQWIPTAGRGDALNNMFPPTRSALLLAAQRQHEQQQQAAQQQGARHFTNDQLLLDAMEQGGKKGRTGTFPQKLHQMLSDLEKEEGGTDIASYLPHGHAFIIHDPSEFVKKIMPKYFRMSRFSSFQRQLNLYEFNRITDGPDKGAYFHDLFHRGRPVLASQIRRNKIKGEDNPPSVAARKHKVPLFAGGQDDDAVASVQGARGATNATNLGAASSSDFPPTRRITPGVPPPAAPQQGGFNGISDVNVDDLARLVAAAEMRKAAGGGDEQTKEAPSQS